MNTIQSLDLSFLSRLKSYDDAEYLNLVSIFAISQDTLSQSLINPHLHRCSQESLLSATESNANQINSKS